MIHPDTELRFISPEVGYGVVAKKFIPKGTITWALDELDREFTPKQYHEMDETYKEIIEFYSFRNNLGNYVLCWDNARFVNHSFNSNCLTTAYDFEIAIRDIHPGEQLTDDYGYLNISEPFRGIDEGTKRKVVYPDDLLRYAPVWDKKLVSGLQQFNDVEQPLKKFVKSSVLKKVDRIVKGESAMDSILTCYFNPEGNSRTLMDKVHANGVHVRK
ncbi:MAG: SET domain-containing protein [Crocinitomicaceae bacterium]|nr:SET domain-containing protein [Crocinitomicaceae bacterium]